MEAAMKRHPYTRARYAIADLSTLGRVQFFCELTREILACPPADWIDSEKKFPSREEAATALINAINNIVKEVPHG
jgi:hypothetical protein